MDLGKTAQLENLLLKVLPSVVISHPYSESPSQSDYRSQLQRCREVYDPKIRPLISLYRPEVSDHTLRDELSEFVALELDDYIRDGLIHSATIAFAGGIVNGSPIGDVVENLIKRAIVDGPRAAAQAFVECTTRTCFSFYEFFLLSGVEIEAPIHLFDGVELIPLPDSVSELPPHLPPVSDLPGSDHLVSSQDLLRKTVVRVEYEASPIFHRPEESYTLDPHPSRHFQIKPKGEDAQQFELTILRYALALAARCSVREAMTWRSLLDYEVFDLGLNREFGAGGYAVYSPPPRHDDPSVRLNRCQLDEITTLYKRLARDWTEPRSNLRVPIERWMTSLTESDPIHKIIDLGIAFESLYVPDSQGELSMRFALHAAWHLGKSKAERMELRRQFKDIYAARSDVVHTGRLRGDRAKSTFDVQEFVRNAQELCWRGITSILDSGAMPDWNDLIMGEDPE